MLIFRDVVIEYHGLRLRNKLMLGGWITQFNIWLVINKNLHEIASWLVIRIGALENSESNQTGPQIVMSWTPFLSNQPIILDRISTMTLFKSSLEPRVVWTPLLIAYMGGCLFSFWWLLNEVNHLMFCLPVYFNCVYIAGWKKQDRIT